MGVKVGRGGPRAATQTTPPPQPPSHPRHPVPTIPSHTRPLPPTEPPVSRLGRRVDGEPQLGLFAIVDAQAFEQQRPQARPGTAADGVEHQEPLQTGAVVGQLADAVQGQVHDLLADRVVPARKVVGRVLLAGDQLLGVEQLAVRAGADFVDDGGLQEWEGMGGGWCGSGAGARRRPRPCTPRQTPPAAPPAHQPLQAPHSLASRSR